MRTVQQDTYYWMNNKMLTQESWSRLISYPRMGAF